MAERLPLIRQAPQQWLDWGGFLGAGRAAVKAVWPQAGCQVVEPDDTLLARSRQALRGPWWTLNRPHAPVLAEDAVPPQAAQMLWANMVLPFEPDVPALLARWQQALAAGGFVMFSTYGPDTLAELRALYAQAGWPAPHAPFADMHDIGDALVRNGFAEPVMDQETLTLHWSGAQPLLDELRSLGSNLCPGRTAGLRTPRWRQRLVQALAARADAQGRIALRFEIVYGHAYRSQPRVRHAEAARVSLDSLKATLPGRRRTP